MKAIKVCLEKFRPQTIYMILGMMIGSFYAIVMGPTTLETPQEALSFGNFHIIAAAAGVALVLGMQMIKGRSERNQMIKGRSERNQMIKERSERNGN